jgi:NAD(P)H dehydrogenase (quinone)
MNHLVVFSHPNPRSFNRAILDAYTAALQERGREVRVRDLYALGFDPVLSLAPEVRAEQEHVRWADVIAFIYPLWWAGMPAIAKGYVDRVFTEGFAYSFGPNGLERHLTGKKVLTITTLGDTLENYTKRAFIESMDRLMDGIMFDFAGLEVLGHTYFGSVPTVTDGQRKEMLEDVRRLALSVG